MKNNIGLVEYLKKALDENWGYVYGTYGLVLTRNILDYKQLQYPNQISKYYTFILGNYLGRRTADCVNLGKGYIWYDESSNLIKYSSKEDYSANGMYNISVEKGNIKNIPDIQGIAVHKDGHFGFYVGDNRVIEAKGTIHGVVETPLFGDGATPWKHWCKMPFIEYTNNKVNFELNWIQILNKVTDFPTRWVKAINILVDIVDNKDNLGVLSILRFLPVLIEKVSRLKIRGLNDWNDVVFNSVSSPPNEWVDGINTVINMANLDSDIGDLEILKFIPDLLMKVYKINV